MIHEQVNVERWKAVFPQSEFDLGGLPDKPEITVVSDPRSVAHREYVFEEYSTRSARHARLRRVPADYFVMAAGEPPRPEVTKCGGVPKWERHLDGVHFADSGTAYFATKPDGTIDWIWQR